MISPPSYRVHDELQLDCGEGESESVVLTVDLIGGREEVNSAFVNSIGVSCGGVRHVVTRMHDSAEKRVYQIKSERHGAESIREVVCESPEFDDSQ